MDLVLETRKKMQSDLKIVPVYAYEITFPETILFIKNKIEAIRKDYPWVKELVFQKPKLPWNKILKEKGFPIFSKQTSVLLNRIKRVKSQNGLTDWIFKINTSRYGLSKERLFLLDDDMKAFPRNIHEDYFPGIDDISYFYSEKCCDQIKGGMKHIKKPSFVGTMASESALRKRSWINYGCNIMKENKVISRPLSVWNQTDIWRYLYKYKDRITINPKYGFDKYSNSWEEATKKLKYQRLGCMSCPYGSHLEDKDTNRFVTLLNESPNLYEAQVIKTGMYKILIDMKVEIKTDQKYMDLFHARWKQIKEWNDNFEDNLLKVIVQIENYNDYKNYKSLVKNSKKEYKWTYSNEKIKQILSNYNVELKDLNEIMEKVSNLRKKQEGK